MFTMHSNKFFKSIFEDRKRSLSNVDRKWRYLFSKTRWNIEYICLSHIYICLSILRIRVFSSPAVQAVVTKTRKKRYSILLSSNELNYRTTPFTGTKMTMYFFHVAISRVLSARACNIISLSMNHEINRWTRNKNNSKQRQQRGLFTSSLKPFPPSIWQTFDSFLVPFIIKSLTISVLQITWNTLLNFKLISVLQATLDHASSLIYLLYY